MRLGPLLLAPLLLAGCLEPGATPTSPLGPLPPSLVVTRAANDTLQVYVHAKSGNVRYAFINLTADNATVAHRADAFALDLVLPLRAAHLGVEVVEGSVTYGWVSHMALNLTGDTPQLTVAPWDPEDGYVDARTHGLPYEKLLERAPQEDR